MMRRRARAALFPYTTLFRSGHTEGGVCEVGAVHIIHDIEEEEKRKHSQGDVMARSVHNLDRRRRHRARGICTHSAYLCSFYTATVAGDWPLRFSRSLLPTNLTLFSRRLQLPIPLGMDLLQAPYGHVLERDVGDGAVHADIVVMLDVALDQAPRITAMSA